jgi:4-amino-4-deoxy-L-arabinose transferase-like glycosyltransferase
MAEQSASERAPAVAERAAAAAAEGGVLTPLLLVVGAVTALRVLALAALGHELMFDEAQYWAWSLHPAFGYFSKPPVVAWLIGLTTAVCGDGEACIRLSSPLLHGGTALLIGLVATRLFDRRAGLWAGTLYLTLPGVSFSSGLISTDVPLLFFWALALYLFVRALEEGRWRWWLALGVATGLGLLSKYAMIYFPACAVLYLAATPSARRGLPWRRAVTALVVAILFLLPNVAWNAANGFVTFGHTAANADLGGPLFHPDQLADFLGGQLGIFGPLLFPTLLVLFAGWRRVGAEGSARLLLWFATPVLALICVQALLSRAHANWAVVSYVAAVVLLAGVLAGRVRRLVLGGSLVLHVAAGLVLVFHDPLVTATGLGFERARDPYYRQRGWTELGAAVAKVRDRYPGAVLLTDERKTHAQLLYYVPPRPAVAVKWNPDGVVDDHFELTTDVAAVGDRPLLWVTRRHDTASVTAAFDSVVPLGTVGSVPYPGLERRYALYLLRGFGGYAPADGPRADR